MTEARITLSAVDKTAGGINSAKARLGSLAGEAEALSTRFGGVAGAIAGALTVGGLSNFFNTIAGGLDRLNDLKDATGASIGNISALEDVAARTGTQFEVVSTSLLKLNQALANAKPGDDISRTLESIGLQANTLRQLGPAEALLEVAKALAQFEDDGNKARASQQLFGRSLAQVAPLLNDLAAAGQLNATVTDDQAEAAERYAQRLSAAQKTLQDMGRTIVVAVLPVVEALQEAFSGAAKDADRFTGVAAVFRTVFETFAVLGANVAFVFKGVGREIGAIGAQVAALSRGDLAGFTAISDAVKADGERARAELDKFERRVMGLAAPGRPANEGGGRVVSSARPSLGDTAAAPATKGVLEQISQYDQYIERLRDTLRGTQDLTEAEKVRVAIAEGKLGDLTDAQRAYALELAAVLDLTKQPAAFVGPEIAEDLLRQRKAQLQELRELADSSVSAQYEKLTRNAQAAADAFRQGTLSLEDFNRVAEQLGKRFEDLNPKLEKVSGFAEQAGRNIQDALGESVLATIEGNAGSIEKIWGTMLKRLVAQAAAAQLGKYLLGEGFAKTGEVGGAAGSLIDFLKGLGGGARAMGGPIYAGRPYLVGERGPELVVPRNNGTVLPNGTPMAAAGGGSSFTINVQGDASENTVRLIRGAIAQFEARQMTRGRA